MVDLPEPESPVNQTTTGRCPLATALACLSTVIRCQVISFAAAWRG